MKTLLVIGKSFSGLKEQIISLGYEYILLQDVSVTKYPNKRFKRRVLADFSNEDSLLEAVDSVNITIDGVVNIYENYVVPAAIIANHLRLPGLPIDSAKACTDKHLMRSLFILAPRKISPKFAEIIEWDEAKNFADNHSYPIILKPANLAKSLLVFKCSDSEELKSNFKRMVDNIDIVYTKYAPLSKPKIMIEEFMEGSIHSVDAFIDKDGIPHVLDIIVDYKTGYDIGYDDNFHYSRILPTKLSESEVFEIIEVAKMGCVSLGMKSSPAHIEIILTNSGPKIVEIGARNGGYRERMHRLANGINILGNTISLSLDENLIITASKNEPCAVLELFPKENGIFKGLTNETKLKSLSSLEYYKIKQPIGNFVGKSSDGYKMCAVIILHNKNVDEFNQDLDYINNNVSAITTKQSYK